MLHPNCMHHATPSENKMCALAGENIDACQTKRPDRTT
jgi:hypothetical protein